MTDASLPPVILYDSYGGDNGHRGEYYAVLHRLIGIERTGSMIKALFARRPVLIAQIEASLSRYVLLCLFRAMLGRHTAGFLMRPLPVIEGTSGRLRVKRFFLELLRRIPTVGTFTILPFSVEPRFDSIAAHWIYDLQFWDFLYPEPALEGRQEGSFAGEMRARAAGRAICCAVGRQDRDKGFDQFVNLYTRRPDLRAQCLFVFGGVVAGQLSEEMAAFEQAGGLGYARFIDHEELLDLYASADLVWCSYSPDYDQASGIFGRAIQLGIPVVVRKGSLIHRFCEMEELAHIAYDGDPEAADFAQIPPRQDLNRAAERARLQGEESIRRLRAALGMS
ncbi:hypothetical protein OLX02_10540 [Novosphingobium sp. KCTC 2891]|uniref:hypothetical protein n=1 Tax=Novosphingobium sp. KCTC 2891 TaxID=2989730 RepID=UPI002222F77C|nr:hypothetical protein [Novosphingobium sp. KCTC 2891]MCW1383260.1 hypothetical protein [Novosphingobium sp. KCTC 2891]